MVNTSCSQSRGPGFNPLKGNRDLECCTEHPKKKRKRKKVKYGGMNP